ncbi:hypothetical protein PtB15_2B117 [Puccinia triticina]|nr:hypothetical protein PtB15_2B117 [Puccinia triticina]
MQPTLSYRHVLLNTTVPIPAIPSALATTVHSGITTPHHKDRTRIKYTMQVIQAVSLQKANLHLVRLNNKIVTKPDIPPDF